MVAAPTIRTWKDYPDPESILTYDQYGESIFDVIDWMMRPPIVQLTGTAATPLANNSAVNVIFNKVIIDTHGFWSPSLPTRITPTVPGWYKGWGAVSYAPATNGALGKRQIFIWHSVDSFFIRRDHRGTISNADDQMEKGIRFVVKVNGTTDYLQLITVQDTGGTVNTNAQANCPEKYPEFFMRWWKPL